MFGLSVDTLRRIKKVFSKFPEIQKVILYGSRAKGNYEKGSDIDITLIGKGLTLNNAVYPLMEELDELYLPYKFDISIFSQLEERDLIDHILRVGKTFYRKEINMGKGWFRTTVGKTCHIVNGGTPKTNIHEYWGGTHAWITPAEMGGLRSPYVRTTRRTLTNDGLEKCSASLLPEHSVILSSRAPIGHLVINEVPMATNQGCRGLIPFEQLHYKFIYYFLAGNVRLLNELGSGATFKELSATKLMGFPIPLPHIPEQKRIVAILDEAFAAISTATANTEKNLANTRALFESELTRVFPASEPALGSKGNLMVNWTWTRLGDVCCVVKKKYSGGLLSYIGMEHIGSGTGQLVFEPTLDNVKSSTFYFNGTHLLYGRLRPYLNKVFLPNFEGHCSTEIFPIKCSSSLDRRFLFYWLTTGTTVAAIDQTSTGARMPRASINDLLDFKLPLPPPSKQKQIVAILDQIRAEQRALVGIYEAKISALSELKQSLLHMAFTGELTADKSATDRTLSEVGV